MKRKHVKTTARNMKCLTQKPEVQSDAALLENARNRDIAAAKGQNKFVKRFLPSTEELGFNLGAMCDAAARFGVVIFPNGSFTALTTKPNVTYMEDVIGGDVKFMAIPGGKQITLMVVLAEPASDAERNDAASYIQNRPVIGTVLWCPTKYIK